MNKALVFRIRVLALVSVLLFLASLAAWPFAAQQNPFDESRIVNDLTAGLQLTAEQADTLTAMFQRQRPRIEAVLQQMNRYQPGSPQFNDFRNQLDREQRAILEDFLSALRPEQQAKLRERIENQGKQPVQSRSPIAPLKPNLPSGAFATGERLIPPPAHFADENTRSRRATVPTPLSEEQRILHLLNRAGFGPRPGDMERVRQMGIEKYLDEQLHPEDLADEFLDRPLQALGTMQASLPELFQTYLPPPARPMPTPTPVPEKKETESLRPTDASAGKGNETGQGKASDQMMEKSVALEKPDAMMAPSPPQASISVNPSPQPKIAPRPTPAVDAQRPLRELQQAKLLRAVFSERQLQEVMVDFWFNHFNVFAGKDNARLMLTVYERDAIRPHALGKFKELLTAVAQSPAMMMYLDNFLSQRELPPPPPKYDADGNLMPPPRRPGLNENYARELMELHTLGVDGGYTQKDVQEVARCLTGWTIGQQPNPMFIFRPRTHDKGEKFVLGKRIAAGGGIEDGLRVLELLARHPSTARFISFKLAQRFIADEPPASLVDRAADVFTKTDGDIREVVRTILTSPEFYSPRYYRNKIKSPLELAASAIRATGAATDAAAPLVQAVARMGEPLYQCQPPTGYSEDSSHWLSSATLLERMNFAVALIGNRISGTRVDLSRLATPETNDQKRLIDNLIAALIHSDVSRETRENLSKVLNEERAKMTPARFDARRNNELIGSVAALVLGSREFQVK